MKSCPNKDDGSTSKEQEPGEVRTATGKVLVARLLTKAEGAKGKSDPLWLGTM